MYNCTTCTKLSSVNINVVSCKKGAINKIIFPNLPSNTMFKHHERTLFFWLFFFATVLVLIARGCLSYESTGNNPEGATASSCLQELCTHLSVRFEEQSVRLHKIETALLRTVSILTSVDGPEFSAASFALKSDPLINSFLNAADDQPSRSTVLRLQPLSDWSKFNMQGKRNKLLLLITL